MIMKTTLLTLWLACCLPAGAGVRAAEPAAPPYKNPSLPVEERVTDLLRRMTLEEKVQQISQQTMGNNDNANNLGEEIKAVPPEIGSLIYFNADAAARNAMQRRAMEESRLGIPILFGNDVIHGFRTIYPIPLAQGCSWNTALAEEACAMAAAEARRSGTDWTFSPMIDVARDGRWGRISEGYGEDPYANAAFCAAAVRGYQGSDPSAPDRVAACLKHYVGYGASEAGLDYVYTEISRQTLWDTYLPPYEAGIRAGALTVMSSFNDISGTPATANPYTLTEVLKKRWGHEGFVVSDWAAVTQLVSQGAAADNKEATRMSIQAGLDMDMVDRCYEHHLAQLVKEGRVAQERVDDAVRRVLRVKFRLGLFEHPYTPEVPQADRLLLPQSRQVAEQMAEESIVLLKNRNNLLPLAGQAAKPDRKLVIAVAGPLLEASGELLGNWRCHGRESDVYPLRQALEEELGGKAELRFAAGCPFDGDDQSGFSQAIEAARGADVVVLFMGERARWSGENCVRSSIELPQVQESFIKAMSRLGKPVVLVLSSGRPVALSRVEPMCDAIVAMWQPGVPGGRPVAGVLSGRVNPSGRLCVTFPRTTGQIPIYYNRRKSSRPTLGLYQDIPSTPLYEFGHGLSYTTFDYGPLKLSADSIGTNGKLTAEITVTNTGTRDGAEVVQWFVSDPFCRITRPGRELKHFEKQMLRAGESRTFRFEIDPMRHLSYVDADGQRFLEGGEFFVMAGNRKARFVVR